MKRKKADEMIQTAVRLPQSLRERLSSAGGEGGLGEEIRRRLEASFDAEAGAPVDPKTRELLDEIEQVAMSLEEPWHANRFAFDVFKAAIIERLARHEPSSEAAGPTGRLQAKYGEDTKPEIIGRIVAGVTGTFRKR